ncbi:MAG: PH domain-containing protein [Lutibacter sp.]|nr:PH domain-containing protein [Lutibacter sp.]
MLSKFRLPGQLPNEEIKKIVRKHIFILIKKALVFIFLMIVPFVFYYAGKETFFIKILESPIFFPVLVFCASFYFLFIWLFFFFRFIDYYLDIWIVTNERIIDIRQDGFFSRTIAEQRLFRVQDVASEVHGIFPTILKYGDVHIQTAGAKQRFVFDDVPHPEKIRDLIIRQVERNKKIHRKEMEEEEKNEL